MKRLRYLGVAIVGAGVVAMTVAGPLASPYDWRRHLLYIPVLGFLVTMVAIFREVRQPGFSGIPGPRARAVSLWASGLMGGAAIRAFFEHDLASGLINALVSGSLALSFTHPEQLERLGRWVIPGTRRQRAPTEPNAAPDGASRRG